MTHNSSVNFKLRHFLLWIKGFRQSSNFETFEWSGEHFPNSLCHFRNHKHFQLKHYLLSSKGVHESANLSANSSAQVKICQMSRFNFETTSQFLFIFCIILHCHDTYLLCKFYTHIFSTLDKRIS